MEKKDEFFVLDLEKTDLGINHNESIKIIFGKFYYIWYWWNHRKNDSVFYAANHYTAYA